MPYIYIAIKRFCDFPFLALNVSSSTKENKINLIFFCFTWISVGRVVRDLTFRSVRTDIPNCCANSSCEKLGTLFIVFSGLPSLIP